MSASAFRRAVEAHDIEAAAALLANDVTFHSPAVFKAYHGAPTVSHLLRTVYEVFEDFRYTDELTGADGVHALIFEARVGDRQVQGMDLIRPAADGTIADFTVMVRPASGLAALAEAMATRLAASPAP